MAAKNGDGTICKMLMVYAQTINILQRQTLSIFGLCHQHFLDVKREVMAVLFTKFPHLVEQIETFAHRPEIRVDVLCVSIQLNVCLKV